MKIRDKKGKPARPADQVRYRNRIDPAASLTAPAESPISRGVNLAMLVLVIFSSAVVPLVVYLKTYDLFGNMLTAWTGEADHIDFFNAWKAALLVLVFVLLIGLHIVRPFVSAKREGLPRLFLPLGLFMVFAMLSTVASNAPDIAFNGFVDRSEGLWVLLSYGLLAYTAFHVSRDARRVRLILTCIFCGSLVVAGIGYFQFIGMDVFQTDFGMRLMLPKVFEQFMDQMTFNFGKNIMYTTVFNPNYLGSYASLLLPVAWGLTLSWAEKGKAAQSESTARRWVARLRWVPGILFTLGIFILWLGSMSRAGLLGGVFALIIFVLLQGRAIVRNPIPSVLLVAGMVSVYLLMNGVSGGLVGKEFQQTLPSSIQLMLGQTPVTEEAPVVQATPVVSASPSASETASASPSKSGTVQPAPAAIPAVAPFVKSVTMKDNRFIFETETETLQIVMEPKKGGAIKFFDGNSSPLAVVKSAEDASVMGFPDKRYAAYLLKMQDNQLGLTWYQYNFLLSNEDGVMTYCPKPYTYWTEMAPAPHFGFEGHERFATNRGWIWSRTIPMLVHTLFTGYGPDTFAAFFPQTDVAWKMNLYGQSNIVVDKPHNWYLQTAVNTGVVSLGLLLWFLGALCLDLLRTRFGKRIRNLKSLFGKEVEGVPDLSSDKSILLTGILCGILGYALAGVFNDSVVSVAPVFWTMTGLGAGLLRLSERAEAKEPV